MSVQFCNSVVSLVRFKTRFPMFWRFLKIERLSERNPVMYQYILNKSFRLRIGLDFQNLILRTFTSCLIAGVDTWLDLFCECIRDWTVHDCPKFSEWQQRLTAVLWTSNGTVGHFAHPPPLPAPLGSHHTVCEVLSLNCLTQSFSSEKVFRWSRSVFTLICVI
jgi:hypothetical protein